MGYSFTKDYKMEEVAIAWGGNAGEDTTQDTDINNTGATDDSQ